jgi:hypothetical protein
MDIPPPFHPQRRWTLFSRGLKSDRTRNRQPFWSESTEKRAPMRENRKDKRIAEENRVAIEVPGPSPADEPRVVNALTKDISLGGARLVTDRFFEIGTSLRMTLYLSKSKQIVKARADVRWNRMVEDGLYEMGVEFEHGIPTGVLVLIQHLYGKGQSAPTSVQP